ncbi:DUF421 domain-containing protein [Mucilaginibacter daejeonensis]|uniref:DUF421 domain-containing protein n=1 Tax=Mucilaginibacter daejeonensis TaxID=398049 RepID=UPI001D1727FA|nr:YetF domain-containing protein [Mucilaginibacter daejeonensis]UEG51699.1 DUF421 domain-containing protein [Mucilaginibacter daejeonensis]
MKKDEIHLNDLSRILFGQAPPEFLLEVALRTLITYFFLLIMVNLLGKRMSGQLTVMEMAVMLTLGAIVSVPMQTPDRGILQGLLLLLCAVGFQRGVSYLGYRSHWIENVTQGKPSLLVSNGVLKVDQLREERISRQQLFAEMRSEGIFNLGAVDRVYLEACGLLSIYKLNSPRAGLPLYSPDDEAGDDGETVATQNAQGIQVCISCGAVKAAVQQDACTNCHQKEFTNAVL